MEGDTESEIYQPREQSKLWEYLAICTCSCMSICTGSVLGWNSPSGVKLLAPDSPIPVTADDLSTLVAAVAVGLTLGPLINIFVVDKLGRKNTILFIALPLLLGWTLIILATNIWMFYIARFLGGICLGLVVCVSPMYIGEISSPKTRGIGGAIATIGFNAGILLAFVVVPYLSISTMAGVFLAMGVLSALMFSFMPESPYFLVMRNRLEEAEEVLAKLRGKTDVSDELEVIMASVSSKKDNQQKPGRSSWTDIFTVPGNRRAFIIIFVLTVTRFFGGFFTILNYGQLIFQSTSDAISDYTANVSVGVIQLISAIVITLLVDKLGRRPLILFSGTIGGLANFAIGGFFYATEYMKLDVSQFALVPFVASMAMMFVLNCGVVSLQFIMLSEVFATDVKAVSATLISASGGILGAISCKFYVVIAIMWNCGHSVPFLGSGVVLWVCTAILMYYTPETKGKTLAQIQQELNKNQ